jgi:hypothetical protein
VSRISNFETNENEDNTMTERTYKGIRFVFDAEKNPRGKCVVTAGGKPLTSVWEQPYETVPEFEWGSEWGRGCKNLAVSILKDVFKEELVTFELCNRFRRDFIARFPFDGFEIKESVLEAWLDIQLREMEKQRAKAIT